MPVEQTTILNITCDNPSCPGNELDANERAGWTFINAEVYGEPTYQFVYCCSACAGTTGDNLDAARTPTETLPA